MKRTYLQRLPVLIALTGACAAGLSLSAHAQRLPIGTNEIAFADFDNTFGSGTYTYFYSDGNVHQGTTAAMLDTLYLDPPHVTNFVSRFTFDDAFFPNDFASWWGTGFGITLPWSYDPSLFNSLEPADYILSFDARVEGLAAGQTTANCVMEFRLAIQTDVGERWAVVKALPYAPGSNWTHFTFNLEQGSYIGADGQPTTSLTTFTNGIVAGITKVSFNQNQPNPTQFGFDADNAILLDNIKLDVLQYAGPPPPPPPKVALPILNYNFDDKALWWVWPAYPETTGGWSQNANKASYWGVNPAAGEGIDGGNALKMGMDNSLILTDPPGKPQWAGGNMSAGGPGDYSQMVSTSLQDYVLTLDARALGLLDQDNGSTTVIAQFIFNTPDNTIQPPDSDTGSDMILRLNVPVNGIKSNWQTLTASLKDGSVDAGSLANFTNYLSKISEIQFQIQIQNPHNDSVWGVDADNGILVDNFKLARLVIGTPPLVTTTSDNTLTLTWAPPSSGSVVLQSASNVNGPWTTVQGATSPYTVNMTAGSPKFFRNLWVPPAQ